VRVVEANDIRAAVKAVTRSISPNTGVRSLLEAQGLLHRLSGGWSPGALAAVDSAFPKSPTYLVGASLSLVAVASILSREDGLIRRVSSWLLVEEQGELDQDYVSAYARLMERREALRVINEHSLSLVLVDGEVMPRAGRSPLWSEVTRLSKTLAEAGVCIVGVLKRSYASSIARRLGLQISDRSLGSAALQRGEAIYTPHSLEELRKRGCVEALYKPHRGLPTAVKVEMCGCQPLRTLSWLARAAGASGLPWPVDLVDTLAKKEAAKISAIEAVFLSTLARREMQHLGYTANPQEALRRKRGAE